MSSAFLIFNEVQTRAKTWLCTMVAWDNLPNFRRYNIIWETINELNIDPSEHGHLNLFKIEAMVYNKSP